MSQYFRHGAGANGTETSGLLQIPVLQCGLGISAAKALAPAHFPFCRVEECMVLITFSAHQAAVGFVTTIKSSRPNLSVV